MTTHSELGASICHRWWNCPGSVPLSRTVPGGSRTSAPAERGTAGHMLAEMCLGTGQDAGEYVARKVNGIEIDSDLAEAVQAYLDECRRLAGIPGVTWRAEVQFSLEAFGPPAPMFGTADFTAYDPATRTLYVRDLKTGYGQVPATSPQLRYYALGATLAESSPVSVVDVGIVQGGRVKPATYSAEEIAEWSVDLLEHAHAALAPGAPLAAGDWCKYCPAAGVCPEQTRAALAVAQDEFGKAPEIRLLTPEQVGAALHQAAQLESWIGDLREAAKSRLALGGEVPGWKLVQGQGRQRWTAEIEVSDALADYGLGDAEVYKPREVASPAEVRKALAAKIHAQQGGTKKAAETAARGILEPITTTKSATVALVPAADPRPALPAAGAEFATLPATVNQESANA